MGQFEWQAAEGSGRTSWWRIERDEMGRQRSVRVRAVDQHDTSPEVPRSMRDPRLCEACDLDMAHTGAWHRQFVPFRPSAWSSLLGREQADPLLAA